MSVIFSDNFNAGSITGWSSGSLNVVNSWGNGGTPCNGCGSGQAFKVVGVTPNVGAIRAQVACILSADQFVFGVDDFNGGNNVDRYQLIIYLRPDGSFRVRVKISPFGQGLVSYLNTPPGMFPVNGVQFGLQIRWSIGSSNSITYTVNNVDVATVTWNETYIASQWDRISLLGVNIPIGFPKTDIVTTDDFEVDNSNAKINWPAGNAPKLDVHKTCLNSPSPPPLLITRFEDLSFWDDIQNSVFLRAGWGLDGGNAITCSQGYTEKVISGNTNVVLSEGTVRFQYGYLYVQGVDDYQQILQLNSTSFPPYGVRSGNFRSNLFLETNGALRFQIHNTINLAHNVDFYSAPGVFKRDGTIQAVQVRWQFPVNTTINFEVLVNDVSVITGTHTPPDIVTCVPQAGGAIQQIPIWVRTDAGVVSTVCEDIYRDGGINEAVLHYFMIYSSGAYVSYSSAVEFIVDPSYAPKSYLPGNAATGVCSGPPLPPPLEITGLHTLTQGNLLHDRYNNSVEKKIPDPTIRTAFIGE
jgi:hypothetical protein